LAIGKGASRALWLIPLLSAADLVWAISAKAGLGLTFGLGLYKWEHIHIAIQVGLIVLLSLVYVRSTSRAEVCYEVEEQSVMEAAEEHGQQPAGK